MGDLTIKSENLSIKTNITTGILDTVEELKSEKKLMLPANYVPANALQGAFNIIQQKYAYLLSASPESAEYKSLQQTLFEMVVMGLNPIKNQCYFIPRGNKLTLFKSYFGDIAVAKNTKLIKDIDAIVIYDGDEIEIEIENGRQYVKNHKTSFGNQDNPIKGAYAVITTLTGELIYTIMTKKEIEAAWAKTSTRDGGYQKDFPQEAAKRTVIRRAIKIIMNSSTDENLILETFNASTNSEYEDEENANNVITITPADKTEEVKPKRTRTKKVVDVQPIVEEAPQEVVEAEVVENTPVEEKAPITQSEPAKEEIEVAEQADETPFVEETPQPVAEEPKQLSPQEKIKQLLAAKNKAQGKEAPAEKPVEEKVVVKKVEPTTTKTDPMASLLARINAMKNQK